jgi:hypothetical protein
VIVKPDALYIDEMLGHWEVKYPGADGVIVESYVEALQLKIDGTFSWTPTPIWAQPGGRWRLAFVGAEWMRLEIEQRRGGYRSNWLVVIAALPTQELILNWQRPCADAVVFTDRVLVARRDRLGVLASVGELVALNRD